MKKNKFLFLLILLFLFLSQPFLISTVFLSVEVSYIIKFLIIITLGVSCQIISNKNNNKNNNKSLLLVLLGFYALFSFINHPERSISLLLVIFDLLFFFELVFILNNDAYLRRRVLEFLHSFSLFVGGIIIISYLIFHKYPGLFSYSDDIAGSGYHGFFNYLLGIINEDKFRPCWYFAEPSYSGFFLGFNFLMALRREYSSKKRRFIEYAVLLGGIFCTGSTGTFVYLILSMGVWFAYKSRIKTSILEIILYCSLIFSIQVLPTIDTFSYFSAAVERSEASFLSRQNRYNIANEVKKDMTMTDLLVGKGPEYVTVKYKEGLSDAYNKMYCEFGILFLIVFLLYVRRLTRKNLPVYCFSLMSYLSIVIFITPIILLCYQCVNWGEELLPQKNSQS